MCPASAHACLTTDSWCVMLWALQTVSLHQALVNARFAGIPSSMMSYTTSLPGTARERPTSIALVALGHAPRQLQTLTHKGLRQQAPAGSARKIPSQNLLLEAEADGSAASALACCPIAEPSGRRADRRGGAGWPAGGRADGVSWRAGWRAGRPADSASLLAGSPRQQAPERHLLRGFSLESFFEDPALLLQAGSHGARTCCFCPIY